jgi:hypothetical protein
VLELLVSAQVLNAFMKGMTSFDIMFQSPRRSAKDWAFRRISAVRRGLPGVDSGNMSGEGASPGVTETGINLLAAFGVWYGLLLYIKD